MIHYDKYRGRFTLVLVGQRDLTRGGRTNPYIGAFLDDSSYASKVPMFGGSAMEVATGTTTLRATLNVPFWVVDSR